MTTYAVDSLRGAIVRITHVSEGTLATDVGGLEAAPEAHQTALAVALSELSASVWWHYTHPASAALDNLQDNSEGWRRAGEREQLDLLVESLRSPNLPQGELLLVSYVRSEEAAHRVGRILHEIGSAELTEAVVAEVESEIAAMRLAEQGDFAGRAAQALLLSRPAPSPTQVSAAFDLISEDFWDSRGLARAVDPVAASVAAAAWLHVAAEVASDVTGDPIEYVVQEADNIEALPHETPTVVLERLEEGESPEEIVSDLVRIAVAAAEGVVLAPEHVTQAIIERVGEDPVRLSTLDPARPALDLLEDLFLGIRGAFLLWNESAPDEPGAAEIDDDDDEGWATYSQSRFDAFEAEVVQRGVTRREDYGI